jgi:pimeloyl-ACP methyl ester carboxylesterase
LSDEFTVTIVERRGRGRSGPQGGRYQIEREVEDLRAVCDAVGARMVFGHSYGGLVALMAARHSADFERVAVYEPGVSINGSFDLSFRSDFRRLLTRGRPVRAMALFLHSTRLIPLRYAPYPVCWALAVLLVGRGGEMRDLMPTTPPELDEVARADGDGSSYAAVRAETLLIDGTRSPEYLRGVLDLLARIVPRAHRMTLDGADHNAPDESDPARMAVLLGGYFAANAGGVEPDAS